MMAKSVDRATASAKLALICFVEPLTDIAGQWTQMRKEGVISK